MKDRASRVINAALQEGRSHLLEPEAKQLCREYNIPTPPFRTVTSLQAALGASKRLGFPVALKAVSPDIVHKTEARCVTLDIKNTRQLSIAYWAILKNARSHSRHEARVAMLVEKMAPPGIEVIIGGLKDPQFGHALMFGLGGTFVEVFEDVSFRVTPLRKRDAVQMIKEVKAYRILGGYRRQPAADEKSLVRVLLSSSRLLEEHPEISQMDLNPAIVYHKGIMVVDARMSLGK